MLTWKFLDRRATPDHLGIIPFFLDDKDPKPAKEQFDTNYVSGWRPFTGHTLNKDNTLSYLGDPDISPLASCQFRDELILIYPYAWVAIIQPDRSCEICRMD